MPGGNCANCPNSKRLLTDPLGRTLETIRRENLPAGATFYQRDISDPGLDELVADEKIDVVSHHAAQVNVRISIADPTADARTNILATLDLIAAFRSASLMALAGFGAIGTGPHTPEPPLRTLSNSLAGASA